MISAHADGVWYILGDDRIVFCIGLLYPFLPKAETATLNDTLQVPQPKAPNYCQGLSVDLHML